MRYTKQYLNTHYVQKTGPRWALVNGRDTVGTLVLYWFTHQEAGRYIGWLHGIEQDSAFRSIPAREVIRFFPSKTQALAAKAVGRVAWDAHEETVAKARKVFREATQTRERAMMQAVENMQLQPHKSPVAIMAQTHLAPG